MSNQLFHETQVEQTRDGILVCRHPSHQNPTELGVSYTCPSIETIIFNNEDAKWIVHSENPREAIRVVLNVSIDNPHTVTSVWIDAQPVVGEVYPMKVVHDRDVGGKTCLDCGVWMPGEGRQSIRASVVQAMVGCIDHRDLGAPDKIYTRCPNPAHSLVHDRVMKSKVVAESSYKATCLFNIIFEKMCTECFIDIQDSMNSNYGIPAEADKW